MERWLGLKSEETEELYSILTEVWMAQKLQDEIELLLPGWNTVVLLKNLFHGESPHTQSAALSTC